MDLQSKFPRLYFLIRLATALLCFGLSFLTFAVIKVLLKNIGVYDLIWGRAIAALSLISLIYSGYVLYLKHFEKRQPKEYSKKERLVELSAGVAVGAGLITVQVIFLWMLNIYTFSEINVTSGIINLLFISIITGFVEELLNKGIIFRILEEGLGSWIALMIVALEVGLSHISNPGATTTSTIAVSIEFVQASNKVKSDA